MTAPVAPWPGDRELAERYAALRHPALVPVDVVSLAGDACGAVRVVRRPTAGRAGSPARLDVPEALRAVGEVALGVQALHDLGLVHGEVRAANLLRTGERWLLDGVAHPGGAADQGADILAVRRLLDELVTPAAAGDSRVAAVAHAASQPAATAGDVGRTALAGAAGAVTGPTATPPAADSPPEAARAEPTPSPDLDAQRRRTRNRMLLIAALVVIVGAALLKLIDTSGTVTVPKEIGRARPAAAADLRRAGLVPSVSPTPVATARPGTVVGQKPAPGEKVRPGRTVSLRVAVAPTGSPAR